MSNLLRLESEIISEIRSDLIQGSIVEIRRKIG